jgi:SAM-dependent methyltransferase
MKKATIDEQADARQNDDAQQQAFRAQLRGMWATVADGWAEHADYVDARGAQATEKMLELAEPRPGERVLELACGAGSVGLAAAGRVAPDGEVVLSDGVAEMAAIAERRIQELGMQNVRTAVLDLQQIDDPEDSYDVVFCREGLMFAPDPGQACREIARVLRPGGRVAVAVWGARERNPWLAVVLDAVGAQLGAPVPPPGVPGPFSLEDPDRLRALLTGAGLSEISISEVEAPLRASSFEDWWERTSALAGPLSTILANLPAEAVEAIRTRARADVARYEADGGLEMPGMTLVASARHP